jgi:hypothetical protein
MGFSFLWRETVINSGVKIEERPQQTKLEIPQLGLATGLSAFVKLK